jgi:HEAT repeat protein
VLRGDAAALDEGRAFVETDDYELMASGPDRLVCQRRAAACALYRPTDGDPLERRDVAAANPARFVAMRAALREIARDHGRYEVAAGSSWPEPLRRGLQGEVEAAPDVAALLDDADLAIRRKAAEVSFDLHASVTAPEVKRALAHDEDDEVRRWSALALARMARASGEPTLDGGRGDAGGDGRVEREPLPPLVDALLRDPSRDWRRPAALALAERGEARACDEIVAWWTEATAGLQRNENGEPPRIGIELTRARELLAATARARCRGAVPPLVRALDDVRARPYVADTLGALGDDRARGPLLAALGSEPYVTTRPREARALLALGVHDRASADPSGDSRVDLTLPAGSTRLVALLSDAHAGMTVSVEGGSAGADASAQPDRDEGNGSDGSDGEVRAVDVAPGGEAGTGARGPMHVELRASAGGIVAVWVIPRPS